ncbi:MAG: hypothetical protein MUC63_06360 [Planctomycetes bacterium]|jgi:hypothetical protein|nr:hypothetical protein [Planctomycetota bacterium]
MGKIRYATCPHCRAYSALDEKDLDGEHIACYACMAEFTFDKELLKTLDEIVEEGDAPPGPRKT